MRKIYLWGIPVVLIFFFLQLVQAAPVCERHYVVGFMSTPPVYFYKSGKKLGVGYELSMEAVKRLGCRYTEFVGSVSSVLTAFSRNQVDFVGPISNRVSFDKSEFVELWRSKRRLLIRKEKSVTGIASPSFYVKESKLVFGALIRGNFYLSKEEIELLQNQNRLKSFINGDDLMRALKEGRIDAVIAGPSIFNHYLDKVVQTQNYVLLDDLSTGEMVWGFYLSKSRMNSRELQGLISVFRNMKNDGSVERILQKYQAVDDELRKISMLTGGQL
ncbi:hypothetical protein [Bdellovibrio sp. HCB274]|uniref:hypothetical protein n=1 Tax=Bdellovibrio sp. HCB274 TaxID=3394361 RepID=UPI0039B67DB5